MGRTPQRPEPAATGHRQAGFRNARRAAGTGRDRRRGLPVPDRQHDHDAPALRAARRTHRQGPVHPRHARTHAPARRRSGHRLASPRVPATRHFRLYRRGHRGLAPRRRRPPQPAALPARRPRHQRRNRALRKRHALRLFGGRRAMFRGRNPFLRHGRAGWGHRYRFARPGTRPVLYHHRRRACARAVRLRGTGCAGPAA